MLELKPTAEASNLFERLTGTSPPHKTFSVEDHLRQWTATRGLAPQQDHSTPQATPGSSPTATATSARQ
jgi:hypothetical protein